MHNNIIFDRLAELSRLEELVISGNDLSWRGVPDSVYALTSLKVLDISHCGLSSIDDRLV